ncbi:MAG: hypothetical protein R3314_00665 [Longimicrobiales bacterium]|nr:hypothetical protein [Longimicrobiales bacterium]
MPTARHSLLKWIAAAVWYVGAGVLLWKGAERLVESAASLGTLWPAVVGVLAVGLGALQGRTLFRRACVRNLRRIRALRSPRPWQFFRPAFFLALAAMIAAAVVLSMLAERGPVAAVLVGGVDWLIGFSLLTGSAAFWSRAPETGPQAGAETVRGPQAETGTVRGPQP